MKVLLGIVVAIAALASIDVFNNGMAVTTDVRAVLPIVSPVEDQVNSRLQAVFGDKVLFAIYAPDEDQLELAVERTVEQLEADPSVTVDTFAAENVNDFIDALAEYRFEILAETDRQMLINQQWSTFQRELHGFLFGLPTQARWLAFEDDPLNLFGRALAEQSESDGLGGEWRDTHFFWETADGVVGIIPLQVQQLDFQSVAPLATWLSDLAQTLFADMPGAQAIASGALFHVANASHQAQEEIKLFSVLSVLGVVLLFITTFRGLRTLVFTLGTILFGCCIAVAAAVLLFDSLHVIALVFGCSLIGVGVDYALHFMCMGSPQRLDGLRRASFLALLSTGTAYLFLYQSNLAVVTQIASMSVVGLGACWLFVNLFFAQAFDGPAPLRGQFLPYLAGRLQNLYAPVTGRGFIVLVSVFGISGVVALASQLSISNALQRLYVVDSQLVANDQQVAATMGLFSPSIYYLVSGESVDLVLSRLHGLEPRLAELKNIGQLSGYQLLSHYLPPDAIRRQNRELIQSAYATNGAVHDMVELTVSAKQQLQELVDGTMNNGVTDNIATELFDRHLPHLWLGEVDGTYHAVVPLRQPQGDLSIALDGITLVDVPNRWATALNDASYRALLILLVTVAIVGVGVLITFRQLASLLIVVLPALSCIGVLLALAVLGEALTLFHIFGLYLVIGLGFDYGIFIYRDEQDDRACYLAILISSLTTMLAFGLLSISSTPMISAFGSVVLCGTIANLLLVSGIRSVRPGVKSH